MKLSVKSIWAYIVAACLDHIEQVVRDCFHVIIEIYEDYFCLHNRAFLHTFCSGFVIAFAKLIHTILYLMSSLVGGDI